MGRRIPVASRSTQGREYILRRTIKGQRAPFVNVSCEIVVRGATRIDLVQFVGEAEASTTTMSELLHVLDSLDVR